VELPVPAEDSEGSNMNIIMWLIVARVVVSEVSLSGVVYWVSKKKVIRQASLFFYFKKNLKVYKSKMGNGEFSLLSFSNKVLKICRSAICRWVKFFFNLSEF